MKFNKLAKNIGVFVPCLLLSCEVFSFETLKCGNTPKKWPNSTYTLNANPVGFPVNQRWWNSFSTAINRFNENPSHFRLSMKVDDDTLVGVSNGESEVWWSSDTRHSPAIAYTIDDQCGVTVEGDIIFYNGVGYNDQMNNKASFWNYGGNSRTFESTAIHEIGHTAGLGHENDQYNIMGTDYTHLHANGNTLRSYLGEDAANGLVWLYGGRGGEDVSVAHWKHTGADGPYSTHGRTKLYNTNGSVLSSEKAVSSCSNTRCERRYNVNPGQQIQYEVTAENNGQNSQNVNIGYYISTNASITNQDILIDSGSINISRNSVDTFKKTLTIPANLNPNTHYFLGAIVDNNNSLLEMTENNNATYTYILTGNSSGGSEVPDACASEGPISQGRLNAGDAACLANQSTIWLSIADVSGHNSIAISTDHGAGNLDIAYSNSGWPNGSNHDGSSSNSGNKECVHITGGSNYWGYIKVSNSSGGASIIVDFDAEACR